MEGLSLFSGSGGGSFTLWELKKRSGNTGFNHPFGGYLLAGFFQIFSICSLMARNTVLCNMKLITRLSLLLLSGTLLFSGRVFAQPKPLRNDLAAIKADASKVWVQVNGGNATSARSNATLDLGHQIMKKFGPVFLIDGETSNAPKGALVNAQFIEWTEKGQAIAFAYADAAEVRRYFGRCVTELLAGETTLKYGVGEGASREAASSDATGQMMGSIQQIASLKENYTAIDRGLNVEEIFERQAKTFSRMNLIGAVKHIVEFAPGVYLSYTYITPKDLEESFKTVKTRIIALAQEGEAAQKRGDAYGAIRAYFKGYIQSSLYFKPLAYTFQDGTETLNLEQALRERVEFLLLNTDVVVKPAFEMGGEGNVQADFDLTFNRRPMSGLFYRYDSGFGENFETLVGGKGSIKLKRPRIQSLQQPFKLKLQADITEDIEKDEELALLAPPKMFSVEKDVLLDLTKAIIIKPDGYFSGPLTVSFELKTRNLSLDGVRWEFGDGEADISTKPVRHNYEAQGIYEVTSIVNGSPDLTFTIWVDTKNQTVTKTKPGQTVEPVPAVKAVPELSESEIRLRLAAALEARSTIKLQSEIKRLRDQGLLTFGRPEQMAGKKNVVVFAAGQSFVVGAFIPESGQFRNLSTNQTGALPTAADAPLQLWIQLHK
jgi:hypothetical protein